MNVRYAVVIEQANGNYAGYIPDLPGCIATGDTPEDVARNIRLAIKMHVEGLREDGIEMPPANTDLPLAMKLHLEALREDGIESPAANATCEYVDC